MTEVAQSATVTWQTMPYHQKCGARNLFQTTKFL